MTCALCTHVHKLSHIHVHVYVHVHRLAEKQKQAHLSSQLLQAVSTYHLNGTSGAIILECQSGVKGKRRNELLTQTLLFYLILLLAWYQSTEKNIFLGATEMHLVWLIGSYYQTFFTKKEDYMCSKRNMIIIILLTT